MSSEMLNIRFLNRTTLDLARIRELAQIQSAEMDETALQEIARLSHRIESAAAMLGFARVSVAAKSIVAHASECSPARFNFGAGASLQLLDLLFQLNKEVFEARTGGPLPPD